MYVSRAKSRTCFTAPIACLWVFIVGPMVGAALAALTYKTLESDK